MCVVKLYHAKHLQGKIINLNEIIYFSKYFSVCLYSACGMTSLHTFSTYMLSKIENTLNIFFNKTYNARFTFSFTFFSSMWVCEYTQTQVYHKKVSLNSFKRKNMCYKQISESDFLSFFFNSDWFCQFLFPPL